MTTIKRIGGRIGAEILGVDLSQPIDDVAVKEIRDALVEHKVIIFRGQNIDDEAHVRFASVFGPLTTAHLTLPSVNGQPNVLALHAPEGARPNSWHTDATFLLTPPKVTTLRSLEIPPYGGDTLFCNTATAYRDLPEHLRLLANRLWAVHSNLYDYGEASHNRTSETLKLQQKYAIKTYRTAHPVISVNPESGAPSLFIGGFTSEIIGLSKNESRDILRLLQVYVTRPENMLRHHWAVGDVLVWDNRSTQHYAVDDYGDLPRRMHRVTVAGDVPVGVDGTKSYIIEGDAAEHYTPNPA